MRSHEQRRAWERVGPDRWVEDPRLIGLTTTGLPGFQDTTVDLSPGFTLLCGVNASGKTRLLRSIYSHLRGDSDQVTLNVVGTGADLPAYIDTFQLSQVQLQSILGDQDLTSRLDQAGSAPLTPSELSELRWLLGRRYDQAEIFELDATYEENADLDAELSDSVFHASPEALDGASDDPRVEEAFEGERKRQAQLAIAYRPETVPYFRLTIAGQVYGSQELSRGELAAMNLMWVLKSAPRGGLMLFDEPDLFLSPQASARALTLIADYAGRRKSPAIVATHSTAGLAQAPESYRVLLRLPTSGESLLHIGTEAQMWRTLRVAAPVNLVLAVEDEAAAQWTRLIADRVELSTQWPFEVWNMKDATGVRAAARLPTVEDATMRFVGILDGDERKRSKASDTQLLYLPSDETPEQFILGLLRTQPVLSDELRRSPERIAEALDFADGDDDHDLVVAVANGLGLPVAQLRGLVWEWWLSTEAGAGLVAEWRGFFDSLEKPTRRG